MAIDQTDLMYAAAELRQRPELVLHGMLERPRMRGLKLRGSMPCVDCGRTVSANTGVCSGCLDVRMARMEFMAWVFMNEESGFCCEGAD